MTSRVLSTFAAVLMGVLVLLPMAGAQATSQPSPSTQQPAATGSPSDPAQQAPSAPQPASTQSSDSSAQSGDTAAGTPDSSSTTDQDKMKADKEKHDGSENDIESIGNRNVGKGSKLGNWYSLEKEIAMGKEYAQQVESTVKLVQDPVVNEYVNRIGQNLVRNSDARVPFTIKVIDSDEINAFALPGGFFYVNSGLILAADEEAELAGVMAHEIAHVAARHATRQMTRSQWANIGSIPLIFVGGGIGYAVRAAASFGLPMTFLTFSRGFEAEADYLGLQYMYKTGYDPQAFISFFEKIQAKEKKKPGTLSKAFATHPQTPDRIEKSQEEIAHVLPPRAQYVVSTSEFDDVKTRLAALENRRKIIEDKSDKDRPSLRRANTGSSTDSTDSNSKPSDDRPTLKRREND
jgi:beta-barrel assembly-enhancing protease